MLFRPNWTAIPLILLGIFLVPTLVSAGLSSPVADWPTKPTHYVTDHAGMLRPEARRALNGALQELEQKTRVQALVVTIESLEGLTKEQFALAVAEHWRLGRKGEDNGLLFLVAKQDRQYRFETGYGLEGILPDSYLGGVGRDVFVPLMRKGDSSAAISHTLHTVATRIAQDKGVTLEGVPEGIRRGKGMPVSDFGALGFIALFWIMALGPAIGGMMLRKRQGLSRWRGGSLPWWLIFFGMFGPGGGRHYGSGGRFGGGGGFGGFGGGMGGGFGGGGAGGSW